MTYLRFSPSRLPLFSTLVITFAFALHAPLASAAQEITFIASTAFTESNVISDSAGNLYGTTQYGGTSVNCGKAGCGTVFEISSTTGGGWTTNVLYNFNARSDGWGPVAGLVFDSAGNLYGTTQNGGGSPNCTYGCGTVFKLSPNGDGTWTESILHRFTGKNDGEYPLASLIIDSAGDLYGSASDGGASIGGGVIFKLHNTGTHWQEIVLHNFVGNDGQYPSSALLADKAGNLYGTTFGGGTHLDGVVFELTQTSAGWSFSKLHDFTGGADGNQPVGNLTIDPSGRIYGTTFMGGGKTAGGYGVVYRLTEVNGVWREAALYTFLGAADGAYPSAGVTFDSDGNLYGTTEGPDTGCNTSRCGQVFQLTHSGSAWNLGNVDPIPTGLVSLGGITRYSSRSLLFTASDFQQLSFGNVYQLIP